MNFIPDVLAQAPNVVGSVPNPLTGYGGLSSIGPFISNILRLLFVAAGVYALFNFVIAGLQFMSAGGDSKAMGKAWDKIWQSLVGLIFIVGSFALAVIFSYLFFGDATFILNPKVYGP